MNELFREIEEDIRNERLQKLWNSFGKLMVRLSIAIVLATVVIVVWQSRQEKHAAAQTALLLKGVERLRIEDYKGAIAAFEAVEAGGSAYYGLAQLRKAEAQAALGDKDGAHKTYLELKAQPATAENKAFVDLAALLAATEKNSPVTADAKSPFYHSQVEMHAWQSLASGNKDEAARDLAQLRDDAQAPRSLRLRAATALEYLGPAPVSK